MAFIKPEDALTVNPLRQFSWLIPVVTALLVSAVISFVSSPVSRLDKVESRIMAVEIAKAATDVQIASLKDQLTEIKASQIVLSNKLDSIRGDIQQLAAVQAAQNAARR